MQPRRIARELALLSIGQLSTSTQLTESQEIESAMTAAIRALSEEVRETLENASADLNRSSDRILESEIKATDITSARAMLNNAIEMTQSAINRLGTTLELPEFIHISQSPEVREFAFSLIRACRTRRAELDDILTKALVDWQLSRLAKIDRNILRLAVAEICLLGIPDRVAINEAVELGKRYSTEEGHRFINGVLRRVTQNRKQPETASPIEVSLNPVSTESDAALPTVPSPAVPSPTTPQTVTEAKESAPEQPAIPAPQKTVTPPPVIPAIKPSFAEPPAFAEEKTPGIEIQQIIPAPPKRVIPAPVKKRGVSHSPATPKKKRVIPSPVGHQDQKRVIPSPGVPKPKKQGVDLPIVKTDERAVPGYEQGEPTPATSQPSASNNSSPWGTTPSESESSEPTPSASPITNSAPLVSPVALETISPDTPSAEPDSAEPDSAEPDSAEPDSADISPWDMAAATPEAAKVSAELEPVINDVDLETDSELVVSEATVEPESTEIDSEVTPENVQLESELAPSHLSEEI